MSYSPAANRFSKVGISLAVLKTNRYPVYWLRYVHMGVHRRASLVAFCWGTIPIDSVGGSLAHIGAGKFGNITAKAPARNHLENFLLMRLFLSVMPTGTITAKSGFPKSY